MKPPPPTHTYSLVPRLLPFCLVLFLHLVSNSLCLLSYLSRTLGASHVFVSSYLFLSRILISLLLHSLAQWLHIDFDFPKQLNVTADVPECLSSACFQNISDSLSPWLSHRVKSTRQAVSGRGGD